MGEAREKALQAKKASYKLGQLTSKIKDEALNAMSDALIANKETMLTANKIDLENAEKSGQPKAFLDRLELNDKRIKGMADGLRQVASLPDPIGEVISMWKRPNGLQIGQRRVPLGVVGIIFEARPNVTADAIGICLKTGNAVLLRGGSNAINSNIAIASILSESAYQNGIPEGSINLIENTDRESVRELMSLNGIVDVLIPRGGAGLINLVTANAKVPVIETGVGNCHVYVDAESDYQMGVDIIVNAKTSRPAVCNAAETLLVDAPAAAKFLPMAEAALLEKGVELRGCARTCAIIKNAKMADESDWDTEYNDYILAIKVVDGVDEAIEHINTHGTKHSEAIITTNYNKAQKFLDLIDAAAVYVNASTRFTDGEEFGFGAEIGISTQKLHARGPMGLKEMTTIKYIIYGNGQIRT